LQDAPWAPPPANRQAIRFLLREQRAAAVPAAEWVQLASVLQALARSQAGLRAKSLARPSALSPDSRRHPRPVGLRHHLPAKLAAQEPARLLKVWESSRSPAMAPGQELRSAWGDARPSTAPLPNRGAPTNIPPRSTVRTRATARRRSPAARPLSA